MGCMQILVFCGVGVFVFSLEIAGSILFIALSVS
jgi:hypothetical protein